MMSSEDFYRLLLKTYPVAFRRQYEQEMAQCFRDQLRAAATPGQWVRLWFRTIGDLLLNVPARHWEMLEHLDITICRLRFSNGRELRFPWASLIHRSTAGNTFGRYSEPTRRALFFARCEASQSGSPRIESEHLLLGVIASGERKIEADFELKQREASLRLQLASNPPPEPRDTSVDKPLSSECKRILAYSVEEAERLGSPVITTGHLILGALRDHESMAGRFLVGVGLNLRSARELLRIPAQDA